MCGDGSLDENVHLFKTMGKEQKLRLNVAALLHYCGAMLGEAARALARLAQLPPQKEKQNKA